MRSNKGKALLSVVLPTHHAVYFAAQLGQNCHSLPAVNLPISLDMWLHFFKRILAQTSQLLNQVTLEEWDKRSAARDYNGLSKC